MLESLAREIYKLLLGLYPFIANDFFKKRRKRLYCYIPLTKEL